MALKPCRECKREVSTEAKACPHCGVPSPVPVVETPPTKILQKKLGGRHLLWVALGLLVLGAVINSFDGDGPGSSAAVSDRPPQFRVPQSGEDVCSIWESIGNIDSRWSQRCTFAMVPSKGGRYDVAFEGDYGDRSLLVASVAAMKLEELDRQLDPRGTAIRLKIPEGDSSGHGSLFTVQMPEIAACKRRAEAMDQRLCMVQVFNAGMKRERLGPTSGRD